MSGGAIMLEVLTLTIQVVKVTLLFSQRLELVLDVTKMLPPNHSISLIHFWPLRPRRRRPIVLADTSVWGLLWGFKSEFG
ncbi:hypothetical protein OPQ81_008489 [Rhizoctonia solani]|nr:hypothetical protein OPQ81_008489 [Rhizoctonia solani]